GAEAVAQFGDEQAGLLEGREVAAPGDGVVPVEQVAVDAFGPYLGRPVDVVGEHAAPDRRVEVQGAEVGVEALGVEPARGCGRVGEPVQADVVQDPVPAGKPGGGQVAVGP